MAARAVTTSSQNAPGGIERSQQRDTNPKEPDTHQRQNHLSEDSSPTTLDSKTMSGSKDDGNKRTVAQIDEELRAKMEGKSGDGGEAGIEWEDGQPVAMKRGVRNNMFRYI